MFACGYNGFQQIFLYAENLDESKCPLKNLQFYAKPIQLKHQEVSSDKQRVIITWSKIHFNPKSDIYLAVLASTWKHTLCRNATKRLLINTDKRHFDVQTDVDIEHVVGSEKIFYSIHDKGRLSELTVEEITQDESMSTPSTSCRLVPRPIFTSSVVTSLSCGKEHVLFLTASSQVFSFGLGSRGQLGHGSVEEENKPRAIEVLDGVGVVQVDAGGWHSAAVTATGDVFTWGWNESGQLGHPSGNTFLDCSSFVETFTSSASHSGKAEGDHASNFPRHVRGKSDVLEGQRIDATNKLISESSKTIDLKFGSAGSMISNLHEVGSETPKVKKGLRDQGTVSKTDKPSNFAVETTDSSELISQTTSGGPAHNVNSKSDVIADDDVVTLQSCPLLVTSLPEDYRAVGVSCGSRHTAVVTDDGKLYTTGWNKYGQLGQGHSRSTDRFGVVDVGHNVIKDVLCGWWNTIIFSKVNIIQK